MALKDNAMRASDISRETGIPRSTVDVLLKRLLERGWVTSGTIRKQRFWMRVPEEVHVALFNQIVERFFSQRSSAELRNKQTSSVIFHNTKKDIEDVIYRLFLSPRNEDERIQSIQSAKTVAQLIEVLGTTKLVQQNEIIRSNQVISDLVLDRDSLSKLAYKYGVKGLVSLTNRKYNATEVTDDYLPPEVEMHCSRGTTYFVNWFDQTVLEINDPRITAFHKNQFALLHSAGKKFDFAGQAREISQSLSDRGA